MEQFIFSVYDKVGKTYFPLIVFQNLGDAFRSFRSYAEDKSSPFFQYPSDYLLTFEGVFNHEGNGMLLTLSELTNVPYITDISLTFADILWCISYCKEKYKVDDVGITTSMLADSFLHFSEYYADSSESEALIV